MSDASDRDLLDISLVSEEERRKLLGRAHDARFLFSKPGAQESPQKDSRQERRIDFPRELHSDGTLTASGTLLGIAQMEVEARQFGPSFVCGVHRGGDYLAKYLTRRLRLDKSRIASCQFDSESHTVDCEGGNLEGNVLLVDDIRRTGKTLAAVQEHLLEKFGDRIHLATMVLIAAIGDHEKIKDVNVDYFAWYTSNSYVALPWSPRENRKHAGQSSNVYRFGEFDDGGYIEVGDNEADLLVDLVRAA